MPDHKTIDLPPLPMHPCGIGWTQTECEIIQAYGRECAAFAAAAPSEPKPAVHFSGWAQRVDNQPAGLQFEDDPQPPTEAERLEYWEGGVRAMTQSLQRILAGEPWIASSPPELAEVARRLAAPSVPEVLLTALRFYARGEHYTLDDGEDFDTVSGEPQNWLCSGVDDSQTMIEDGRIARHALQGIAGSWVDGDEEQAPDSFAPIDAAGRPEERSHG